MSKIVAFALLQVGKPYKFGKSGPYAFDCSGLVKRAAMQLGLDLYHGATTQWTRGKLEGSAEQYDYFDQTGLINDLPMDKLSLVFNQDKTRLDKLVMAHVGIYDGQGNVIQAGGYGGSGVHVNPLNKKRFSHFATFTGFWMERDNNMSNMPLKRGDIGDLVRKMQLALIALGYNVGVNTLADGKFGPATEAAVIKFQKDHLLPATGTWGSAEEAALDAEMEEENGPPVNDDDPMIPVPSSLLFQLDDLSNKFRSFRS